MADPFTSPYAPDEICLQGLRVKCIVGVLPDERTHPQDVICKIELSLHTREVAEKANLHLGVDYREMVERVQFLLEYGRFFLLETAAETIAMDALRVTPSAATVAVTLQKPEVFSGEVVPSLRIVRRREHLQEERVTLFRGATQNCFFAHRHGGLFSVELAPETTVSLSIGSEAPIFLLEYGGLFFGDDEVLSAGFFVRADDGRTLSFTTNEKGARLTCLTAPVIEAGGTPSFIQKSQKTRALSTAKYVHLSSSTRLNTSS